LSNIVLLVEETSEILHLDYGCLCCWNFDTSQNWSEIPSNSFIQQL